MYKLHYVKGINTYDTLQFNSLSDQEDFFDDCVVGQPIDEYYPPLYKNRIKFAFDDISISSLVANYLSLEYKDKTYYYFIDRINYISEDLYEFELTMDTIQTYMFNIKKIGKVSRKSITRYNDGKINRKYVRENISKEDFDVMSSTNFATEMAWLFIVASEVHVLPNVASQAITCDFKHTGTINSDIRNGLYYYVLPLPLTDNYQNFHTLKVGNKTTSYNASVIRDCIREALGDPYTVSAFLLRNSMITDLISINMSTTDTMELLDNSQGISFNQNEPWWNYEDGTGAWQQRPFVNIQSIAINFHALSRPNLINFYENKNIGSSFNPYFVPYLLDENYYKVELGEKVQFTQYPLHQIENYYNQDYLNFYGRYDLESGFRSYKIYEKGLTYDKYITIINIATQPTMVLNTDSWEQYYASNKANYTIGIQKDIINMIWSNVSGTAQTAGRTEITGQTLRNNGLTQIFNGIDIHNPQMMDSGANTMTTGHMYTSFGKAQIKAGIANTAIQMANYGEELKIIKANAESTPNTVNMGNNALNDFANDTFDYIVRQSTVRDFENVARLIEYHGYPVNEYFVQSSYNGFVDFNIRYYYNILQMDGLTLIENLIIPNDLKADFIARLKAGIRLWNIHSANEEIGDGLQYDNVENLWT